MANLVRFSNRILGNHSLHSRLHCAEVSAVNCANFLKGTSTYKIVSVRMISTSENKKDTIVVRPEQPDPSKKLKILPTLASDKVIKKQEFFESWGFDHNDEMMDRFTGHGVFFMCFTLLLPYAFIIYAYMPDHKLYNWSCREGFLELHRREKLGLPLIDKELVDPTKVRLLTDDELGDQELII